MNHTTPQTTRPGNTIGVRPGFTLAELMVVITVIVLMMTLAAPSVSRMMQVKKADAGLGAIKAAVASARSWASTPASSVVGPYLGTAILVTPANELRIVRHDSSVKDGGSPAKYLGEGAPPKGGYKDTSDPYIVVPQGVGFVGIARANSTNPPYLFAPPFAVRFDGNGHMIVRDTSSNADGRVFYDGNYDNIYNTAAAGARPAGYNPAAWDPESATAAVAQTSGKYNLPFEAIETVVGVIAYSKSDLWQASQAFAAAHKGSTLALLGDATAGSINAEAAAWILANGRPILFNRYSGDAMPQ